MDKNKTVKKTTEEKKLALDMAVRSVTVDLGEGSIMCLGDNQKWDVDTISTGAVALDIALGQGGIPRGRITEIYGGESSGKTTLALETIAQAQMQDGLAAFIDVEHALDPAYAKALGVNLEELLVSQPDNGEQAMEIVEKLIRSGTIDVIIVDSVAALVPKAEIDGEMTDPQMGLQARLMSKALRKITAVLGKTSTALIFINQIRDNISNYSFGPSTITSGGKALKFYASIRMEMKKTGVIREDGQVIGNEVTVKVTKNKIAPPFKDAKISLIYGKGFDTNGEILDLAVANGIVEQLGESYIYNDSLLGSNRAEVIDAIDDDIELMESIKHDIMLMSYR